ncbi:MAG: hypothetical protein PHV59_04100 [Victivallales bacterium]|nr:hypothetical protein [Victivallales bacterium]
MEKANNKINRSQRNFRGSNFADYTKILFPAFLIMFSFSILAEEKPNFAVNGKLRSEQGSFPDGWDTRTFDGFTYDRSGGHDGTGAVGIPSGTKSVNMRQGGYKLVPGEKYKLSVWVKTKDFEMERGGFVIINAGWYSSRGIDKFDKNSDWKLYEAVVYPPQARGDGTFALCFFALQTKGTIQISDLRFEPVSEKAAKDTVVASSNLKFYNVIPLHPRLYHIPLSSPKLEMMFPYMRDTKKECLVTVNKAGKMILNKRYVLPESGVFTIDLSGLEPAVMELSAKVVSAKNGEKIWENKFVIRIFQDEKLDLSKIKWKNSLVMELSKEPLKLKNTEKKIKFSNPRRACVYVLLKNKSGEMKNISCKIPSGYDSPEKKNGGVDRIEYMRLLPKGNYELIVKADEFDGAVDICSIPELLIYGAPNKPAPGSDPRIDRNFTKEYIFPNCTTILSGFFREGVSDNDCGFRQYNHFNVTWLNSKPDEKLMVERYKKVAVRKNCTAIALDELGFFSKSAGLYACLRAIRQVGTDTDIKNYFWLIGKPFQRGIHTDLMSSIINSGRGTGRMLSELYCHQQATQKKAEAYLNDKLSCKYLRKFYPESIPAYGYIFAVFTRPQNVMVEQCSFVDEKYYLEMQLHKIATEEEFKGLSLVGYYGTHISDEESIRWAMKLIRHYAIEGHTDKLSDQYGFTYITPYLANTDFNNGLKHWQVKGDVRPENCSGYGRTVHFSCSGGCDNVAVFRRSNKTPNKITQKIQGFVPGRLYSLRYIVVDYNDLLNSRPNPRVLNIFPEFEKNTVTIIPGRTDHYYYTAWRTTRGRNAARVNQHKYVFRAEKPELTLTLADWKNGKPAGPVGEELAVNFIRLQPYYPDGKENLPPFTKH